MDQKFKYMIMRLSRILPVIIFLLFISHSIKAQDSLQLKLSLQFLTTDTTKTVQASLTSMGKPVAGPEIHLYVKGLYSLLPIGKVVATDATGLANFSFPMDLPGHKDGMLTVVAKLEKDEKYGSMQTAYEINWGAERKSEPTHWSDRSLSASREKAPMVLVISSVLIIVFIWGTIFFVIYQLFRIKKAAKLINKII